MARRRFKARSVENLCRPRERCDALRYTRPLEFSRTVLAALDVMETVRDELGSGDGLEERNETRVPIEAHLRGRPALRKTGAAPIGDGACRIGRPGPPVGRDAKRRPQPGVPLDEPQEVAWHTLGHVTGVEAVGAARRVYVVHQEADRAALPSGSQLPAARITRCLLGGDYAGAAFR